MLPVVPVILCDLCTIGSFNKLISSDFGKLNYFILFSSGSKHNQEVTTGLIKEIMDDPDNKYEEDVVKCKSRINVSLAFIYCFLICCSRSEEKI